MARHPWVAQADAGVRFGVILTGKRGFSVPRPDEGADRHVMHDEPLREMIATARVTESLGFDAVFVVDVPHIIPDPVVAMTALAMSTSRVWIGSAVIVGSLRHPALLARMIADIDRLSGGRVVLGLGIGETEDQFLPFDAQWGPVSERRTALEEALEVITGSWGAESFTHHGRYFRTENMRVIPGPLQQPRPPIMIGGSADRTLAQVARHADACNLLFVPLEQVRTRLDYLDHYCDVVGRPREEILHSDTELLVMATTEAEAKRKLHRSIPDGRIAAMTAANYLMVGTPEQAIAHYTAMIDAGIQYFIVHSPDTTDHETLHLLATDVIPHLHP